MAETIKAVVWDMGGVLLKEMDPRPRQELSQEFQVPLNKLYELVFQSESARKATTGAIGEGDHWKWIFQQLGLNEADQKRFYTHFWSGDGLDTQLISFIRELKPRYQTGLLSNAWSGSREALRDSYKCLDAFDAVIISSEIGLAKPDPAIYLKMLNQLGVEGNETIFVDDLTENVIAAKALGMHGIKFVSTEQAIHDVRSLIGSSN